MIESIGKTVKRFKNGMTHQSTQLRFSSHMSPKMIELYEYFYNKHDEFVKNYPGEFIVIAHNAEIHEFDSGIEATKFALSTYNEGTFIVQEVTPEIETDYLTQIIINEDDPDGTNFQ